MLDDLLGVVDFVLELDGVFVDQLLRGEDGGVRAHRERERIAGARVDLDLEAVADEGDEGVERVVAQLRHRDALQLGVELVDDIGDQVVGHRPRQVGALHPDEDGGRFGVADPDGQELVALDGLQQDDRLLADDVEAHPVDDHLLHAHGPQYTTNTWPQHYLCPLPRGG